MVYIEIIIKKTRDWTRPCNMVGSFVKCGVHGPRFVKQFMRSYRVDLSIYRGNYVGLNN